MNCSPLPPLIARLNHVSFWPVAAVVSLSALASACGRDLGKFDVRRVEATAFGNVGWAPGEMTENYAGDRFLKVTLSSPLDLTTVGGRMAMYVWGDPCGEKRVNSLLTFGPYVGDRTTGHLRRVRDAATSEVRSNNNYSAVQVYEYIAVIDIDRRDVRVSDSESRIVRSPPPSSDLCLTVEQITGVSYPSRSQAIVLPRKQIEQALKVDPSIS